MFGARVGARISTPSRILARGGSTLAGNCCTSGINVAASSISHKSFLYTFGGSDFVRKRANMPVTKDSRDGVVVSIGSS